MSAADTDRNYEDEEGNLIINYLPPDMMEGELKMLFDPYGTVQAVKIIRSRAQNSASLGYGFIHLSTPEESEKAIAGLNGLNIRNKKLKVSFARKKSADIKDTNLYIQNIPKTFVKTDLEALFNSFGTIIESKVLVDPQTKVSKGVGFVRFSLKTEADHALRAMNGYVPAGGSEALKVKVAEDYSLKNMQRAGQQRGNNRYNPMGAGYGVAGQQQRGRGQGQRGGFPPQPMQGQMGYGGMPQPQVGQQAGGQLWCLFVYNLPAITDDVLLYSLFCPFGNVASVKVIRDESTQLCKGFAFVNM
eukprot:Awhi_evm1s6963